MNSVPRRLFQRVVEFPTARWLGIDYRGKDVLELGCGSGYGASLLLGQHPRSYVGIDLMPEQIRLAEARRLPRAEFLVGDATDLSRFATGSKDLIVIFGVLHHIPAWRVVLDECGRVLRPGGELYVEEPDVRFIRLFERIRHWGHPLETPLALREMEAKLRELGFAIDRRLKVVGFGLYHARKLTTA